MDNFGYGSSPIVLISQQQSTPICDLTITQVVFLGNVNSLKNTQNEIRGRPGQTRP